MQSVEITRMYLNAMECFNTKDNKHLKGARLQSLTCIFLPFQMRFLISGSAYCALSGAIKNTSARWFSRSTTVCERVPKRWNWRHRKPSCTKSARLPSQITGVAMLFPNPTCGGQTQLLMMYNVSMR